MFRSLKLVKNYLIFRCFGIAVGFFTFQMAQAGVNGAVLTYHGRLLHSDNTPVTAAAVQFKIQIRTPGAESCLLFEETQTLDLSTTSGVFVLGINDGSVTRSDTSGLSFQQIFGNNKVLTFPAGTCASGTTYTPTEFDGRNLHLSFNDGSGFDSLPAQAINYAPKAIDSLQVAGFPASSLLRVAESTGALTPISPISNANYTELLAIIAGTSSQYVKSSSQGATLPSVATAPTSPVAGQIWFDSTAGTIKLYNGTATQTLGTSGGSVQSVASGTGLTGGPITTTGTLSLDVSGVTAGTYPKVTVDAYGRATSGTSLVEADIPNLTTAGKVSGSAITSGTIAGSTAINTSGLITTTGTVTAAGVSTTAIGTQTVRIFESTNAHKVTLQAPASLASGTDYSLTLPSAAGSAGQTLVTDASGNLSWVSPSIGSVTAVTASSPLGSSGGTTPNITLPVASASADGYLSQANWTMFNSKLTSTLASANIFVGNGSSVATAVAASGDVSLANTGAFTVNGVKGKTVSATPTANGQVLRYDGTNWTPNFVSMFDMRSTVTGAATFGSGSTGCTSNQTLTWTAATDNLACTNISLPVGQISGTLPIANGGTNNGSLAVTAGGVIYTDGAKLMNVGVGTTGQFLTSNAAGAPTWTTASTTDATKLPLAGGTMTGALVNNTNSASTALAVTQSGAGYAATFMGGNLGIGTTTPAALLDVNGTMRVNQICDSAGANCKTVSGGWGPGGDMILASAQTVSGAKTFNSGNLILAGSTSGTTTLNANAVAGSGTVVLPTTGTLSTLAGTETLTNKTLTSPTMTTPTLGVATATSVNKLTITQPATGSTLTVADGKTLTSGNTLTFTGTDGSTLNIGGGGTLGSNAYTSTAYAPLASPTFTGTVTIPSPFTLAATSVTSTGAQLNYLSSATGTTGTSSSNVVFSDSPTFTTSIASPMLIGGTDTLSTLTYKTTTGVGAAGADHIFQVGNNGATEAMRILNSGFVGIGTNNPGTNLEVNKSGSANGTVANFLMNSLGTAGNFAQMRIGANTSSNNSVEFRFYNNGAGSATNYGALALYGQSPAITFTGSGNVGIGTTSPSSTLSFSGQSSQTLGMERNTTANTAGNNLTIQAGGANNGGSNNTNGGNLILSSGISVGSASSNILFNVYQPSGSGGIDGSTLQAITVLGSNGYVGIGAANTNPSYPLDVSGGTIRAASVLSSSDARLKTNVRPIEGLDLITQLSGVRFDWIKDGQPDFGVIAQQVEQVLPEAVSTDGQGFKSVKYQNLVAPLIESVKELNAQNMTLKQQVNLLNKQNSLLYKRLNALEERMKPR